MPRSSTDAPHWASPSTALSSPSELTGCSPAACSAACRILMSAGVAASSPSRDGAHRPSSSSTACRNLFIETRCVRRIAAPTLLPSASIARIRCSVPVKLCPSASASCLARARIAAAFCVYASFCKSHPSEYAFADTVTICSPRTQYASAVTHSRARHIIRPEAASGRFGNARRSGSGAPAYMR